MHRKLSKPFLLRRLHSIAGFWILLYLIEHLFVNFQAALYPFNQGRSFVAMVSRIHKLPYLPLIELAVIGLPFLLHGLVGIAYARESKLNSSLTDGTAPSLPYRRNRAFSWQRITSWILLIFIVGHVVQMRFLHYPLKEQRGEETFFLVPLSQDQKLEGVSSTMGFGLVTREGKLFAETTSPGTAFFLIVRETFKSLWMALLYSVLVIASTYHAFNGLWTFMISWGVILTQRAQAVARRLCHLGMLLATLLGLGAIWGVYGSLLW